MHRRLAARNILLNFLKEIKIAGFGPQPTDSSDNEGDGEKEKRVKRTFTLFKCICIGNDLKNRTLKCVYFETFDNG